jgi:hypothetical protein
MPSSLSLPSSPRKFAADFFSFSSWSFSPAAVLLSCGFYKKERTHNSLSIYTHTKNIAEKSWVADLFYLIG